MKTWILAVVLIGSLSSYAQDKPKPDAIDADRVREAQARLAEKDKARQAEREKLVTISAGELADLRARIEQLEAEVKSLKGAAPVATKSPARTPTRPEVGMTRAEVERWVKSTLGSYRIASTMGRSGRGAGNTDTMKIERVEKVNVATGSKTNSLGQERPTYGTEDRAELAYTVTFTDGVATAVR